MNNLEILEHAIGKAKFRIENEFNLPQPSGASDDMVFITSGYDMLTNELGYFVTQGRAHSFISYQRVIFSHSFAKAFFGEDKICRDGTMYDEYIKHCVEECGMTKEEAQDDWEFNEENVVIETWEYHLQQMVLSETPLKYLEQFWVNKLLTNEVKYAILKTR